MKLRIQAIKSNEMLILNDLNKREPVGGDSLGKGKVFVQFLGGGRSRVELLLMDTNLVQLCHSRSTHPLVPGMRAKTN